MKDDICSSVENQFCRWKIQYQSTQFRKWSPWRFLHILNLTKNDILVFVFDFKLQIWLLSSLKLSLIDINTMFKQCDIHLLTVTQLYGLLQLPTQSLETLKLFSHFTLLSFFFVRYIYLIIKRGWILEVTTPMTEFWGHKKNQSFNCKHILKEKSDLLWLFQWTIPFSCNGNEQFWFSYMTELVMQCF